MLLSGSLVTFDFVNPREAKKGSAMPDDTRDLWRPLPGYVIALFVAITIFGGLLLATMAVFGASH